MFRWLWRRIRRLWRKPPMIYIGGAFTNAPEGAQIATWNGAEWIPTKKIPGGAYKIVIEDDEE